MNIFKFFSRRSIPQEGDKDYKSLRDYTQEELHFILENNEVQDLAFLAGICSEVLRRMINYRKFDE